MAYYLEGTHLRVVAGIARCSTHKQLLRDVNLILLQHVLPTTEAFIRLLQDAGANIHTLLCKPYSIDAAVETRLANSGLQLVTKSYSDLESTTYLSELVKEAVDTCEKGGKRLAILEVGGYFAKPLTTFSAATAPNTQVLAGIVEDTTFGHNRYVKHAQDIPYPVFSVARSPLKEIEARFIGKDAVAAAAHVLRELGNTIAGRNALVLGYGMIGSNVARTLRSYDLDVSVYDIEDYKNLRAFVDGYRVNKKFELLKSADIIFSATAKTALTLGEIKDYCKDNVILASVGSKDTEFDVAAIKQEAGNDQERVGAYLVKYKLLNSHHVYVLKDGTAVNFLLPSLPVEVLDLVFAEILHCLLQLLRKPYTQGGRVYESDGKHLNEISKSWASYVNQ